MRYWLYYDEDLRIGTGSGIFKNPWNTNQGLRKRSLQGSAHGSLLQPKPKFHGAGPCTHGVAIIAGAENGWKLHNPHLLTTNRDGVAKCGWVSNSKHGCKYPEIRTPSQLLSAHSSSKGSMVVWVALILRKKEPQRTCFHAISVLGVGGGVPRDIYTTCLCSFSPWAAQK